MNVFTVENTRAEKDYHGCGKVQMLQAFHNDPAVKQKCVDKVQADMDAGNLVRGEGFRDGRGCAVGCMLDSYDHRLFPEALGMPVWVAHLIDFFHENTSEKVWPSFALRFLKAVPVGANLDLIKAPINIFILTRNKNRVVGLQYLDESVRSQVVAAIDACIALHQSAETTETAARAVESAAETTIWSAADFAMATKAARAAGAAGAAAAVAMSAAVSAEYVAGAVAMSTVWSAEYAAEAADRTARADGTAWSAESAEADLMCEELLRLVNGLENG